MPSDSRSRGFWATAVWVIRFFWACRVSVLSAFAGVALFYGAVPAQNLMADLSYIRSFWEVLFWFGVFAGTFLMWSFPVHYAARTSLDEPDWMLAAADRRLLGPAERAAFERAVADRMVHWVTWVPRALGLVPFAALGIGIYKGAQADVGAVALPAGAETIAQAWWLGAADLVTALAFLVFVVLRRRWTEDWAFSPRALGWLQAFTVAAWVVTLFYFVCSYFFPIVTSVWTPRALLIPPLFGCSVLALSALTRYAHREGAPVVLMLALAAIALTALNAPFNDLRTITSDRPSDGRLRIETAVAAWKIANGCSGKCPRPIVLAIDGGASRAAFAASTFVGDLLDGMAPPRGSEASTPGRRLFAISGVSGGAYGAAVMQAALADAQGPDPHAAARTPCRTADRTWFRYPEWSGHTFNWRQCLQALTSGDYLSTTIIGLAFRDAFAPPGSQWLDVRDRATLLEQSFERHYDYTVRTGLNPFDGGATCGGAPAATGLCRLMAHPTDWLALHPGGWMPLLMLNGTSVRTGRRLVSADLASSPSGPNRNGSLYNEAFDLHEAMSSPCPDLPPPQSLGTRYVDDVTADASADGRTARTRTNGSCGDPGRLDGADIRLSTAALTSARFPVISPAGAFVMRTSRDPQFGDQVVDGGYFENSGITTALDVAAALREAGLDPILVSIGNDPEADRLAAGLPRRPAATPLVPTPADGFGARATSLLGAPLNALLATRDGHADEALHDAQAFFASGGYYRFRIEQTPVLDETTGDRGCREILDAVRKAGVPLVMTKVSMSWWLSAAVQADLDAQRCSRGNRAVTAAVLEQVAPPP